MEEKPRSRFAGLVNIIMMLAISAGMVFGAQILGCNSTGHVTETKNKTKENFTENCYSYIMYVAKKGRYHDANVALCLCQESGDNIANQNKCSRGIDLQNFKEAVDSCKEKDKGRRPGGRISVALGFQKVLREVSGLEELALVTC